ncbi:MULTISPECIES: hypothetical protein [unclassified Moorena]|nr:MULTISPECIES: hypothetical protein [unclassified Moorena]NEO08031.1 hypothetical protein [Moorena sp. SIO3I8]NEP26013.1 hypothetical protein [Moorena sp. SIO3I6]
MGKTKLSRIPEIVKQMRFGVRAAWPTATADATRLTVGHAGRERIC